MQFKENLFNIMSKKGISAYKLYIDTGIAQTTISSWKKGKLPTIDKIEILVQYFGVTSDELLGIKNKCDNYTDEEKEVLNEYRNAKPEVQESARLLLRAGKQETKLPTFKTG